MHPVSRRQFLTTATGLAGILIGDSIIFRAGQTYGEKFLETRLGKPWRTTYGMLDSRFDAKAFINYVCPAL